MSHLAKALSTVLSLLFVATLLPSAPADDPVPVIPESVLSSPKELHGSYPLLWHRQFSDPMAGMVCFDSFNLSVIAAGIDEQGPVFLRWSLGEDFLTTDTQRLNVEGLPPAFSVQAMAIVPVAEKIIVAGTSGGSPMVFRADITPKGDIASWERLPFTNNYEEVVFRQIIVDGVHVFLLADRNASGYPELAGWAGNVGPPGDKINWVQLPPLPRSRVGEVFLEGTGVLMAVGGTFANPSDKAYGKPASVCYGLKYDLPNVQGWEPVGEPISRQLTQVVGVSHGMGNFILSADPDADSEDSVTSATLHYCMEIQPAEFGSWEKMTLAQGMNAIRAIIVDPAHAWMLVMTAGPRPGLLDVYAYELPKGLMRHPITPSDARYNLIAQKIGAPRIRSFEEVLDTSKKNNQDAILVIASGDGKTDTQLKAILGSSGFRYMAMNTQVGFYEGGAGQALIQKYGIKKLPALILVDSDGKMLREFSGSIPTPPDLFQLTTDTRRASESQQDQQPTPASN